MVALVLCQMDQLRNAQCVAVACLTLAAKLDGPEAVDNVAKFQVWHCPFIVHRICNGPASCQAYCDLSELPLLP